MSKFKDIFDSFLKRLFVKKCIACKELLEYDYQGSLCGECTAQWEEAKRTVCEYCYDKQTRCRCGFGKRYVDSVRHLALYDHTDKDSVVNAIVYELKKGNDDEVFNFVAREMADNLISINNKDDIIVANVPRSPKSVRRYGYDHAKKLAICVAKVIGTEYVDALGHSGGKTEQKKLNMQQRALNAKNNCFIRKDAIPKIKGKTVLLIDDIGTTGAMTGICAELLRKNGALKVQCILCAKNKLKR